MDAKVGFGLLAAVVIAIVLVLVLKPKETDDESYRAYRAAPRVSRRYSRAPRVSRHRRSRELARARALSAPVVGGYSEGPEYSEDGNTFYGGCEFIPPSSCPAGFSFDRFSQDCPGLDSRPVCKKDPIDESVWTGACSLSPSPQCPEGFGFDKILTDCPGLDSRVRCKANPPDIWTGKCELITNKNCPDEFEYVGDKACGDFGNEPVCKKFPGGVIRTKCRTSAPECPSGTEFVREEVGDCPFGNALSVCAPLL